MVKKKHTVSTKLQLLVATGMVLLLVIFGLFVGWLDTTVGIPSDKHVTVTPSEVTLKGEPTCLKHRGDGPVTLECAMAIKLPGGDVYALEGDVPAASNNTLEVTGTLRPPVDTSVYESDGTITIKK